MREVIFRCASAREVLGIVLICALIVSQEAVGQDLQSSGSNPEAVARGSISSQVWIEKENPAMSLSKWGILPQSADLSHTLVLPADGDKASDLAVLEPESGRLFVALSDGSGKFSTEVWGTFPPQRLWRHFNGGSAAGKGVREMLAVDKEGEIWRAIPGSSHQLQAVLLGTVPERIRNGRFFLYDFDGDKQIDVLAAVNLHELQQFWLGSHTAEGGYVFHEVEDLKGSMLWDSSGVANLDGQGPLEFWFSQRISPDAPAARLRWLVFDSASLAHLVNALAGYEPLSEHVDFTAGDLKGNGVENIVMRNSKFNKWIAYNSKGLARLTPVEWAYLNPQTEWDYGRGGDFNGDGRFDLVVWTMRDRTFLFSISNGESGVPLRAGPIFSAERCWANFVVGDFDGDGADDLAGIESTNGGLWVALSRLRTGAQSVALELRTESGATVKSGVTGIDGTFRFEDVPSGKYNIVPAVRREVSFFPQQRPVVLSDGDNSPVSFSAYRSPLRNGPFVCNGFQPGVAKQWGGGEECLPGYGVFAAGDASAKYRIEMQYPDFSCCRLPMSDILTGENVIADLACPDDHIITRRIPSDPPRLEGRGMSLECSKINTNRYQLGPAVEGRYWGIGFSYGVQNFIFNKYTIPPALRSAVGRDSLRKWDHDGCIGYPWGSLLVELGGGACHGQNYRQLQYRGSRGDPPRGTPVQMIPECGTLSSPFDPHPNCIPAGAWVRKKTD